MIIHNTSVIWLSITSYFCIWNYLDNYSYINSHAKMSVESKVEVGHTCWPTWPTEQSRCDIHMTHVRTCDSHTEVVIIQTTPKNSDMKQYHRFLLIQTWSKLHTNESSMHYSPSSDPNLMFMINRLATMVIPTSNKHVIYYKFWATSIFVETILITIAT